jgi:hypothetical protein
MPDDLPCMSHHRDPMALLRFAVREGDLRLVELILRALRREGPRLGAGSTVPAPPRSTATPSPLAHRTLDALLILLGIDEASRRRQPGPGE